MRNVYLHFAVTMDGIVSNVEEWVSFTDEAMEDTTVLHDSIGTIILGKNTYGPLAEYWENAETASESAGERAFARMINDMQKLVLSHGEVELVWRNSGLLRARDSAEFKEAITRLKSQPGKDIAVDSGEGTYRSFLENDLWDGIDMLIHPLAIGKGESLFASLANKTPLRLVTSKTYPNGVVNLRYVKEATR